MILIYSKDVDDFVNQVIDCFDSEIVRFSESDNIFFEKMEFSSDKNTYLINTKFLVNINLDNLKSIWFNGGGVTSNGNKYETKCYEVLNDSFLLQKDIYKIGKRYSDFEINRLDVMIEAKNQGLKIPHTIITGNKQILIDFYKTYKGKNGIISKRILDGYFYFDEKYKYNFNLTFEITENILDKTSEQFAISFFQKRIIADFEIRTIYIDGLFYSSCIFDFINKIDYRTSLFSMENLRIIPYKLPKRIESKITNVFKKFKLNFGSVDLMYKNKTFYFLEINTTGQISYINNACNFNLEKIIANLLKNGK